MDFETDALNEMLKVNTSLTLLNLSSESERI